MADMSSLFSDLLNPGISQHRLCVDFAHPQGLRDFLAQCKGNGMLPEAVDAVCIHTEGQKSVWLVARRKETSIIEMT